MTTAEPERGVRLAATLLCFVLLWLVLDRSAAALGSFRGEAGAIVCALVIVAAIAAEYLLSRKPLPQLVSALGLCAPRRDAVVWTIGVGAALCLFFPAFAAITGAHLKLIDNAWLLALGMFAQGGIAEEAVFRGFLFRRLRVGRTFWAAAWLAAIPFVAVHALLFLSLDFPLALASLLLSLSLSFPFARLFELGGASIWPPAILHAIIQGAIKLIEPDDSFAVTAVAWMAVGGLLPWAIFLHKRPEEKSGAA